jgi:transcriptional regulator with XRE-family HTH domain
MLDVTESLAQNLRRIRRQRGLSLSALARSAGLSKATLSGLERGSGNPSVDTLWSLAQALNVPFGALFEDQAGDDVTVTRLGDAQVVSSEGGFTGRRLLTRDGRGRTELYVLDLERHVRRDAAAHPPGVVEHVIVMKGRVDVGPDGDSALLAPGDCVSFPADRPHHYHARSGTARLLSFTEYPPDVTPR